MLYVVQTSGCTDLSLATGVDSCSSVEGCKSRRLGGARCFEVLGTNIWAAERVWRVCMGFEDGGLCQVRPDSSWF